MTTFSILEKMFPKIESLMCALRFRKNRHRSWMERHHDANWERLISPSHVK